MSKQTLTVVFLFWQSPEGGYVARALEHSIFTQAETRGELRAMIREAVRCHFGRNMPCRLVNATRGIRK
jgi:predicted RNase H-like HicB family nuclease